MSTITLDSSTLAQRTADGIRKLILSGAFSSGQILRQEDLAKQLGVSRIPVREALRQLDAEGFIHLHPHRGATVSVLSPDEALEIYEIRASLETLALKLAIPNLSADDLAQAEAALDEIDSGPADLGQWALINWRFHSVLYEPCHKPRLLELIKALHDNVSRYLRTSLTIDAHTKPSQKQHRDLLAACKKRDVQLATQLLERHLATTGQKLVITLREQGASA